MSGASRSFLALLLLLAAGRPGLAEERTQATPHLCAPGEIVRFACAVKGGKVVSLCASPDLGRKSGWLEYRFGTPAKVELTFPADRARWSKSFLWRFQRHASSCSYELEFENGGFTYVVYDQDTLGTEAAHGSGVAVRKGSKSVASLACTGDAVLEIASLKGIVRTAPDSQEEP